MTTFHRPCRHRCRDLRAHAPGRVQRGAAMVEFIVGALFVSVPMYLAVQAFGKFADVQHTANAAARYAAWERTVWFDDTTSRFHAHNALNQKTGAQIRSEVLVRVLNDRRSPLKYAAADKGATTFANGIDPLWHDTADEAYLKDASKLGATLATATPSKDLLGSAIGLINAISIPHVTGSVAPPVPSKTLATAVIALPKVAETSTVYQRLWSKKHDLPEDWKGLDFEGRGAVLSNTWAANSRVGTKAMVSDSVPTANALGTAITAASWATLLAWDPMVPPRMDIGKVTPDVVPADRLK